MCGCVCVVCVCVSICVSVCQSLSLSLSPSLSPCLSVSLSLSVFVCVFCVCLKFWVCCISVQLPSRSQSQQCGQDPGAWFDAMDIDRTGDLDLDEAQSGKVLWLRELGFSKRFSTVCIGAWGTGLHLSPTVTGALFPPGLQVEAEAVGQRCMKTH